ncbi:MAG: hypothetical protein HJJLKODD_01149 [Phycisphaerae bacterium]|nr:hypothetical protein [Phycisphaerae bacterium]
MADVSEPMVTRRQWLWAVIVMALGLLFWFLPPIAARQEAVIRGLAPVVTTKALIQKFYVEEVEDKQLLDGAIAGMVAQLDPHSHYFTPSEYAVFLAQTSGGYAGIGITFNKQGEQLVVESTVENSPAFDAGLLPGDVVIEVAGRSVEQLKVNEISEGLRGVEGSIAHFKVRRPATGEVLEFSIPRKIIHTHSIYGFQRRTDDPTKWSFWLDEAAGIGYIRISEFWDMTGPEFDAALAALPQSWLKGLIVDLRFNPGGDVVAVQMVVERLLWEGVMMTTRNRREVVDTVTISGREVLPGNIQMVVLVNNLSASGAEILSGVLQYYKRAVVVGQRSYGKGSVQSFIPLEGDRGALKLTVAYYYLPSGRCIHRRPENFDTDEWGVLPDVMVPVDEMEMIRIQDSWREAAVIHNEPGATQQPIRLDPQLTRAIEIVRGKIISQPTTTAAGP